MSKARNYCFTVNNWTDEERTVIQGFDCKYLVYGEEVGENGTPHLQGYIELHTQKSLDVMKKKFNARAHYERRRGTAKEAADYCKKDGVIFEVGTISAQGERKDLQVLKQDIVDGKSVDAICMECPITFHMYGRTLERIESIVSASRRRTEMTEGIWYFGGTGAGKSHMAFEECGPDTYIVPNDKGWWDGYTGQANVIFNDFRGGIPYNEMLKLVDKWPETVPRRGKAPMPFTSARVYVTSSLPPNEVYCNRAEEDNLDQLWRRFKVFKIVDRVKIAQKYSEGNTRTSEPFRKLLNYGDAAVV